MPEAIQPAPPRGNRQPGSELEPVAMVESIYPPFASYGQGEDIVDAEVVEDPMPGTDLSPTTGDLEPQVFDAEVIEEDLTVVRLGEVVVESEVRTDPPLSIERPADATERRPETEEEIAAADLLARVTRLVVKNNHASPIFIRDILRSKENVVVSDRVAWDIFTELAKKGVISPSDNFGTNIPELAYSQDAWDMMRGRQIKLSDVVNGQFSTAIALGQRNMFPDNVASQVANMMPSQGFMDTFRGDFVPNTAELARYLELSKRDLVNAINVLPLAAKDAQPFARILELITAQYDGDEELAFNVIKWMARKGIIKDLRFGPTHGHSGFKLGTVDSRLSPDEFARVRSAFKGWASGDESHRVVFEQLGSEDRGLTYDMYQGWAEGQGRSNEQHYSWTQQRGRLGLRPKGPTRQALKVPKRLRTARRHMDVGSMADSQQFGGTILIPEDIHLIATGKTVHEGDRSRQLSREEVLVGLVNNLEIDEPNFADYMVNRLRGPSNP